MKRNSLSLQMRWLKMLIVSVVLFFVGACIGIALSFPTGILEQRLINSIEQQSQVAISQGSFSFGFVNLTAKDVVIDGQPDKNIPPLRIDKAKISPLWGSLLSDNRGFHVDSQLMSGTLVADVFENGQVTATAKGLIIEIPIRNGWNLNLTGQIEQADFDSLIPLREDSQSALNLILNNVSVREEGKDDAMLTLGHIELKTKGKGQAFRITELTAKDGDFNLEGRGNLRLGSSPRNSTVSLRVTIKPTASADSGLVELLKLAAKEKADGEFEVRVSGNLASPSIH